MIPVELRLTNFMSYKHMDEPLNFSSIHTAVLCGPNGHGKSSLLDAVTWALWGQARGVDRRGMGTDDLIHHKSPHMQVEFTFDLEGQCYRVIRSRTRKGKTGLSRLEFQVLHEGEPRSLTGETISATQEAINKMLRMDYETFVNSAFIMQGQADNFMAKSANERKEILSEILGLSVYDELEDLAREKRRELNERLRIIDARILDINQELERLTIYKEEFAKATDELEQLQSDLKEAEAELARTYEKKTIFDTKSARLSEISSRCALAKSDVSLMGDQLGSLKESIGEAEKLLNKEDDINTAYTELIELRKKDEELTATGQKHSQLEIRVNGIKLKVAKAKSALESEVEHLSRQKAVLEKDLSCKPAVEASLAQTEAKIAELKSIVQEVEDKRKRYSELREKRASLEASVKMIESKLADGEKRRSLLTGDESCPLCKKALDKNERMTIDANINKEISELKDRINSESAKLASIARELDSLETAGKSLSQKIKDGGSLQVDKGRLEAEISAFRSKTEELSAVNRRLGELNLRLAQDTFAQEEQSELNRLLNEIDGLGYSIDEHHRIKDRIKTLANYERLKANLENARQTIETTGKTIESLEAQRRAKLKSISDDEIRMHGLEEELAMIKDVQSILKQVEEKIAGIKKIESAIIDRRSTAQVKLDNCSRLSEQKGELSKERMDAVKEAEIYDKLAFVFSKKGIQALIIENTIPEIEDEANTLLHRLTNNQMNLRFVTQKSQKTGGIIETLDLIITDGELGERKYELFSGGEAFRINFAVRIALSKFLARRAGARLETLVIDEGFGTQDEEGKEKLIEAITTVQDDFKKIIIVTHLEDLKEFFPARIEVLKERGVGSIVTVM